MMLMKRTVAGHKLSRTFGDVWVGVKPVLDGAAVRPIQFQKLGGVWKAWKHRKRPENALGEFKTLEEAVLKTMSDAPIDEKHIWYKKIGHLTFVWVGANRIGEIYRCYRTAKKAACGTCGHVQGYQVVSGYGLKIYGRFWRDGDLVPKGSGGYSAHNAKRRSDVMAKVEELFG